MSYYLSIDGDRDEHSKNIGYIKGGKYDGEILSVINSQNLKDKKDEITKEEIPIDKMTTIITNFIKDNDDPKIFNGLDRISENIKNRMPPEAPRLKKLYDECIKCLDKHEGKEIVIPDGELLPIFDTNKERTVFYVSGMSGSGKSTLAGQLISVYQKIYPNNKVIVFSNKDKDEALDKYKPFRINIDEDLLSDPITLNELKQSLVIFDDIDCIPNKKLDAEISRLRDLILQQGRSFKTSFVYISHLTTNYKQSKLILLECDCAIIFPAFTTQYNLKYLLYNYFGLGVDDIRKIRNLPSRWCAFWKNPLTICYTKGAYIPE